MTQLLCLYYHDFPEKSNLFSIFLCKNRKGACLPEEDTALHTCPRFQHMTCPLNCAGAAKRVFLLNRDVYNRKNSAAAPERDLPCHARKFCRTGEWKAERK